MSDRVLVALPDGRWIALSPEVFREALAAGAAVVATTAATTSDTDEQLLSAEQLAEVLSLPQSWIEQAAREGRVPSIRAGRWRRFRRTAVEAALAANGRAS